ncbi:FAD-binding protein [Arthrobacter sp. 35W]|uniref:FAD-binding protein n=1 Tax=Arthrobacter sp. 35W TaxID=1132441 RepID=UPI0006859B2A|nr:FAD/NAD(P)-binding protein [Arthrobacter sp. 35W]
MTAVCVEHETTGLGLPLVSESCTTVVIGSGFSGLAVASELCRQGVNAVVVDGANFLGSSATMRQASLDDPAALNERADIMRLLRRYADTHQMDVRPTTAAVQLSRNPDAAASPQPWVVHTAEGVLLAQNIVLTRCAQNQLRSLLRSLGIKVGRDILSVLRSLGMYLVGVGDLVAPTTREILQQAKQVGAAISIQSGTPATA